VLSVVRRADIEHRSLARRRPADEIGEAHACGQCRLLPVEACRPTEEADIREATELPLADGALVVVTGGDALRSRVQADDHRPRLLGPDPRERQDRLAPPLDPLLMADQRLLDVHPITS